MTYTEEEKKENRKLWIDALRSGSYTQGYGVLRNRNNEFCCLGVLATVMRDKYKEVWDKTDVETLSDDGLGCYSYTPDFVDNTVGLNKRGNKRNGTTSLPALNDGDRLTFGQIADVLETEETEYFK